MPTQKLVQIKPERIGLRSSYDSLHANDPALSEAENRYYASLDCPGKVA